MKYVIDKSTLTAIAGAVREIANYQDTVVPEKMPDLMRDGLKIWKEFEYKEGYESGYATGYEVGKEDGKSIGSLTGYNEGYNKGQIDEQQITDGIITREATTYTNNRVTKIGAGAFRGYTKLQSVRFDNVKTTNGATFHSCTALTKAEFNSLESISGNEFYGCTSLASLIIRTPTLCVLTNTNALTNTPIVDGAGFVYVLDNLVSEYKGATNWSTFIDVIKPISEYTGG